MKREHCVAAVLDREMEKTTHIWESVHIEKVQDWYHHQHSPIQYQSLQSDRHFVHSFHPFHFFLVFLSADLCLLSCRIQLWHLTCNPIKQANVVAPYVGCQSMCTQPAHNWVLATWWLCSSYRFKYEDTESCTICWTAREPSGDRRAFSYLTWLFSGRLRPKHTPFRIPLFPLMCTNLT